MQAHATSSCGSPYHVWWANACQLWKTHGAWIDPCKGLRTRSFRLLWANLSSLARSVHLYCGPMQASCLAAICLTEISPSPCDILVQQPKLCLIGQCILIGKNIWCMNGPMQGLAPKTLYAAVGQLKFIRKVNAFASQANASIFISSYLANCKLCRSINMTSLRRMGQLEAVSSNAWINSGAISTLSAALLLAGSGPSGGHQQCIVLQVLGQFNTIGHTILKPSAASLNEMLGHFKVFHTLI